MSNQRTDVIVVGGGHAGIEAAVAAARLGARTVLVTHDPSEIGRMPCNPAIGGLGKGHLVREIDALGGVMGRVIDRTGIQFRLLNRRKGPAVRSPRAQADKLSYQRAMVELVHATPGLVVVAGDAADLLWENAGGNSHRIAGVVLADGRQLPAYRVVLCTGTFLGGLMHVGERRTVGGREGAAAAIHLGRALRRSGFSLVRLKTGTPPRLERDSLDLSRLEVQKGDEPPLPFSLFTDAPVSNRIDCYLTHTTQRTHEIIRENLERSPLYGGIIEGTGPRYCPSIEDKVVRFPGRSRHHVFLEPEGIDSPEIYVNGISTSLPAEVQAAVVHSIPGLEKARLVRYGYAVEYDSVPSWQVTPSLESKPVAGLFLAGQILGTSGYEEAAAQGLLAGLNAVRSLAGESPLVLGRREAYIGVLIDDLVTKEITEPYRMFTSRGVYRLALRCDNVAERLLPRGQEAGLLTDEEIARLKTRAGLSANLRNTLKNNKLYSDVLHDILHVGGGQGTGQLAEDAVTRLIVIARRLTEEVGGSLPDRLVTDAVWQVVHDLRYEGYIRKQERLLREQIHLENMAIPVDFPYASHPQISHEAREKLTRLKPATLGQAARIDGVRTSDLSLLAVLLRRYRLERS